MKLTVILLFTWGTLFDCAKATVLPISSSLNLHAESNAGMGLVQDDHSVEQTTTLNGLSASVFAQAVDVNGTLKATSESTALATWTSASEGQFSIDTKFTTDNLNQVFDSRVATGGLAWIYAFSSDAPATLTLNYGITDNISNLGMDAYIELFGGPAVEWNELNVPSSGSLSFDISPGRNYMLELYDGSNANQNLSAFTSEMMGTFSFQVTTVPEPNSLTLLGIAVAAFFSIHRRKTGAYKNLR